MQVNAQLQILSREQRRADLTFQGALRFGVWWLLALVGLACFPNACCDIFFVFAFVLCFVPEAQRKARMMRPLQSCRICLRTL
jgi:hypothetical protein